MWDETNFLLKGFINEVKGALTESGGGSSGGGMALMPYPVQSFIAKFPDTIMNAVTVPYFVPVPVSSFEEVIV